MLPPWIESWWEVFGGRKDLHFFTSRVGDAPVGIAPLQIDGCTAGLIGDADVCDYLDFIVQPDAALPFFDALIQHLRRIGIKEMDLHAQRPDSAFMRVLSKDASRLDCEAKCEVEDETYELELPDNWDAYLATLRGKDRHEIRRKVRRLCEAGRVSTRIVSDFNEVDRTLPLFMKLFKDNRSDKAAFMTDRMTAYFRLLAQATSREGFMKLLLVELDSDTAAAAMFFDYRGTRYLYNNGYAQRYQSLSVGHLSKVYSIRDGLNAGMQRYDFLKGRESYKRRLGGRPVPVYRCRISL